LGSVQGNCEATIVVPSLRIASRPSRAASCNSNGD